MKFRKYVVAAAIMTTMAGTSVALMGSGQGSADAATATISTSSTTKVMVSSLCYRESSRTVTVYYHSAGHGWRKYAAPKVTTSVSTHCYAK